MIKEGRLIRVDATAPCDLVMNMAMKTPDDHSIQPFLPLILLFGLVFVCYASTFKAPWYFDDLIRIVNNPAVHMTELTPAAFMASLDPGAGASHARDSFFRPVAMLSLALNWYFANGHVAGFHLVNILIHILAAVILYRTILLLAQAPQAPRLSAQQARFIALLASALWAVHPIQTQAVTYIIQRTTSLAGLFFIAGLYSYVRGRQSGNHKKKLTCFTLCAGCYLLAVGTKLNTAILPLSIFLVDTLFFQDLNASGQRLKIVNRVAIVAVMAVVLGMGLLWFLKGDPLASISSGYQGRPFTMAQRLMTEPRILFFYLSQLFFPSPDRFSLVHDIVISKSLVTPWTTLAALVGLLLLVGIGVLAALRMKFLSLAILFYLLNHLVESSVIPLELIYEHRNYLPSMFLFVPPAILVTQGIDHWRRSRRYLSGAIVAGTILLMVSLGIGTYTRNAVWASEKAFWEDALVKASKSARPYMQLAAYYENRGQFGLALKLYARSLDLYDPAPQRARAGAYNNMGTIFNRMNNKDAAIEHYQKALAVNPRHEIARYNLLFPLIASGRLDEALAHAQVLIKQNPTHPYYQNSTGYILLQQGRLGQARQHLEKALRSSPSNTDALINLGLTLGRMAHYPEAVGLLEHARRRAPAQPSALLGLIEVHTLSGNDATADQYADQLIRQFPLGFYYQRIAGPPDSLTPYDVEKIRPILARQLKSLAAAQN